MTRLLAYSAAAALALGLAAPAEAAGAPPTIAFSSAWTKYVLAGDQPVKFTTATASPGSQVTLIWSHEVAGNLALIFGNVAPGTLLHVSFSETAKYLHATSDWYHTYPTDDHVPSSGEAWVDTPGCQSNGVCDDGYRAFRFARVYAQGGSATITAVRVLLPASVRTPQGWFLSSDDLLNRAWYASAYTAQLMVEPNDPTILDPRGCQIAGGTGRLLILDGAKRDRCPWLGDQVVTDQTLLLTNRDTLGVAESTLSIFADAQQADGYIPASPSQNYGVLIFDYPALWVTALDNVLLYGGDRAYVTRYWPNLQRLLDVWFPSYAPQDGLVLDTLVLGDYGASILDGDYAFINRGSELVAYYNAGYVLALRNGAAIADLLGHPDVAKLWRARADALAPVFDSTFWDPAAGAFLDSPDGPVVHPQDGNAFAILAGLATPTQAASAIRYLDRTTSRPWGNAIADNDTWASPDWGSDPSQRVYPFMTYFDVMARFMVGADKSALDELRRTWGWMLDPNHGGPGTTWEAIGGGGSIADYQQASTSMAQGWSSGAAPALTNEVLGVRPTGPGFSTFDAIPHPGDLAWAQGGVPTPVGTIRFAWKRTRTGYLLRLSAPPSLTGRVGAPAGKTATVLVDGRRVAATLADGVASVELQGSHVIEVRR